MRAFRMTEVNGTFSLHASLRAPSLSYKLNFVNFCVGIWGFFKYTEYVKKCLQHWTIAVSHVNERTCFEHVNYPAIIHIYQSCSRILHEICIMSFCEHLPFISKHRLTTESFFWTKKCTKMYLTDYTKIYWHTLHNICTTQANTFNMSQTHRKCFAHWIFHVKNTDSTSLLTIITNL